MNLFKKKIFHDKLFLFFDFLIFVDIICIRGFKLKLAEKGKVCKNNEVA